MSVARRFEGTPSLGGPIAVVAMGGHAFTQSGDRGTYEDHERNARQICRELIVLVERGYRLVITHGNGPQVGELLLRQELTRDALPRWPLDVGDDARRCRHECGVTRAAPWRGGARAGRADRGRAARRRW